MPELIVESEDALIVARQEAKSMRAMANNVRKTLVVQLKKLEEERDTARNDAVGHEALAQELKKKMMRAGARENELKKESAAQKAELGVLAKTVSEQKSEIDELRKALAEVCKQRDEGLQQLRSSSDHSNTFISSLRDTVSSLQTAYNDRETRKTQADKCVEELRAEVKSLQSDLTTLRASLAVRDAKIAELQQEMRDQEARAAASLKQSQDQCRAYKEEYNHSALNLDMSNVVCDELRARNFRLLNLGNRNNKKLMCLLYLHKFKAKKLLQRLLSDLKWLVDEIYSHQLVPEEPEGTMLSDMGTWRAAAEQTLSDLAADSTKRGPKLVPRPFLRLTEVTERFEATRETLRTAIEAKKQESTRMVTTTNSFAASNIELSGKLREREADLKQLQGEIKQLRVNLPAQDGAPSLKRRDTPVDRLLLPPRGRSRRGSQKKASGLPDLVGSKSDQQRYRRLSDLKGAGSMSLSPNFPPRRLMHAPRSSSRRDSRGHRSSLSSACSSTCTSTDSSRDTSPQTSRDSSPFASPAGSPRFSSKSAQLSDFASPRKSSLSLPSPDQ